MPHRSSRSHRRCTAKFGAVDILVNGAGWGKTHPFWEGTPEMWERVIALNFVGPMRLAKALLPAMIERGSGKIVNVASDAGRVGSLGETVYAGAKGGLIAFTKSLARETARYNINVNCVCPGPTETPLLFAVPEKHLEAFKKAIPFRRFGKPAEVADAVVFFASDRSQLHHRTGAERERRPDDGRLIRQPLEESPHETHRAGRATRPPTSTTRSRARSPRSR